MSISIGAPNADNYLVGKGIVYFQPEGAAGVVDDYPVGNVTEFEIAPKLEKLDHYSSMSGTRTKDRSVVTQKGLEIKVVMEEFTPRNMQLMLIGALNETNLAAVSIDILSLNSIRGHLKYVGTNDVGPKWTFDLPVVEFSPSGSLNPIGNEWGGMEITGEAVYAGGTFGSAVADFSAGTVVPANTIPPTIYGTAQTGQTLHALKGLWTGFPTVYGYQWQHDAGAGYVDIAGKTAANYVVEVAYVGQPLRVRVTATNPAGTSAPVASAPTALSLA